MEPGECRVKGQSITGINCENALHELHPYLNST